ncbi:MAG: peptidylprolyl isomerase [Bacteroidales bacterium]|nr:peptidylprolyl isomerase [Bacteroidales bacterium]
MKSFLYKIILFLTLIFCSTGAYATSRIWHVKLVTNRGEIVLMLFDQTPLHRDNFIKLAKDGYFNGVLFHRVINNFMIQSGDPDSRERKPGKLYGKGGPEMNIPAEFSPQLFHKIGAVAAAREGDDINPFRESSGSQFYIVEGKIQNEESLSNAENRINVRNRAIGKNTFYKFPDSIKEQYMTIGGTPHLDTQYTVFGQVVSGMDVVHKISDLDTDSNDRPMDDVFIISTYVYKKRIKIF